MSVSGVVVAVNDAIPQQAPSPLLQTLPPAIALSSTGLPFDEEVKLVYGVILSLRNMIKKLAGRCDMLKCDLLLYIVLTDVYAPCVTSE